MKTISASLGLLLSFFILCQTAIAQSSIDGKISDANGPLPFANVLLLQPADSSLVRGSITNDDGTFQIEKVPAGNYLLSAQMVGYQSGYQPIELRNERLSVGEIQLSENVSDLNTVTVTAKKPLFEQKLSSSKE